MSEPTGKGSIILKLVILLLIVVVIAAILYPQKQWKRQAEEEQLCRLHMENLYYSTLQYLKRYKTFFADLDSLLRFMESDSMMVPSGLFEVEKLTIWESPRDSFLVGFPDTYHYEKLDWEYCSPESLMVWLVPKERFVRNPESKMLFASNDEIPVERRQKGEDDIYIIIWGKSLINYERIPVDSVKLPIKYYAITEDPADFRACPACGEPYDIATNVSLKLKGEIVYNVLKKEGGNVQENEFLSHLFIKKLKSEAAMEALKLIKTDTTIFIKKEEQAKIMMFGSFPSDTVVIADEDSSRIAELRDSLLTAMKDSLVNANFYHFFSSLKAKSKVILEEEVSRIVDVDSVSAWDDSLRIRDLMFSPELNEKEKEFAADEDVSEMLKRLEAAENYYIAKIDTVGLTISCPIDSIYINPDRTLLQKIFGVGPAINHGEIINGDYSWSEKK